MGVDELRTTLVPHEITRNNNIFYKDFNNAIYDTKIFVKTGFLINDEKQLYPNGFILNSLVLIPYLTFNPDSDVAINIFSLLVLFVTYLFLYLIFIELKLSSSVATVGAFIFVISNFYLSLYVSYFPDNILLLVTAALIYLILKSKYHLNPKYLVLIFIFSSFLLAYKITMYPILFTFYFIMFFYFIFKNEFKSLVKYLLIFITIFSIYNFPLVYSNMIGPSYAELAGNKNDANVNQAKQYSKNIEKSDQSKLERMLTIFVEDFITPKESGKYLIDHLNKDVQFFAKNNIFVLFGVVTIVYLLKKQRFLAFLISSIFITSFLLWGNMNVYGGSTDFHIRNSHIRYLLPIFMLFYVLGYWGINTYFRSKKIFSLVLLLIVYTSISSLVTQYPFNTYSIFIHNNYLNTLKAEKRNIEKLNLPLDGIYLSAVFDDYDLSYKFDNYGDLKLLSKDEKKLYSTIDLIISLNNNVYFVIPKKDSSYNPFSQQELNQIAEYITTKYKSKVIFENDSKQIYITTRNI